MDNKSYVPVEDAESFREKFYVDCVRWICNLRGSYFPETTGVLDMWHLKREFKKVFGVGGSNLVAYLKDLALKGGAKRIVEMLREEALRQRGEIKTKVKDHIEHVSNNYQWIENTPLILQLPRCLRRKA